MLKILMLVLMFAWAADAQAQDQSTVTCPEYDQGKGIPIQFSTDNRFREYGFQSMTRDRNPLNHPDYEALAGKRAWVSPNGLPGLSGVATYYPLITEDCQKFYWYDSNTTLDASDGRIAGVEFLEDPPTKWQTAVDIDRLTDIKTCTVTPQADVPFPMFFFRRGRAPHVGMVGGDFPGRPDTFRVDKKPAIRENEGLSGPKAQQLIAQIRAGGKKLLTGSYRWPYDTENVAEFNLGGLVEKLDECKRELAK